MTGTWSPPRWKWVGLLAACCLACSSSPSAGAPCAGVSIDRFKELTIVDDAVIGDMRALNANDGPWSFRHAVENMVPQDAEPGQFVLAWFNEWVTDSSVNGYAIPDGPQVGAAGTQAQLAANMNTFVLCPWLRATSSNGCDATCSKCTAKTPTLDLASAPFRLLAIVNRMDLSSQPGINPLGEGRLVFGLTDGPADNPASRGMSMTLIFEYALPPVLTLGGWADAWHQLGSGAAFDEDYNAALQAVTDRFVSRDAMPGQPNGSALSQSRTNENVLFWAWQMRQFQLGTDGQMHAHTVRNTPDPSLNGSAVLTSYLESNSLVIDSATYLLPDFMLSGAADETLFKWNFPGVDPVTQLAFTNGTCDGCHSDGSNPPVDTAFHVSPLESGIAKLSPYVNNPYDPSHDELARRTSLLQGFLCSP